MPPIVREYKDLDLDLVSHPISGDLIPLRDTDAVKRSVRNILLTNIYERPYRPNIGTRISHLLFEPVDPLTKFVLQDEVYRTILANEPRARVLDVIVNFNFSENRYDVAVQFSVENISEIFAVSVFLQRAR